MQLVRRFGHVQAVDGVSLRVNKGEIVGLLGPNGAGKTTTMRMLTGALVPTSGRASIGGVDVVEQSLGSRKLLGYLPENNPFYPDTTVEQHLGFVAEIHGLQKDKARDAMNRVLAQLDIKAYMKRPIGTLSKGLKQRVGLAQTLIHDPPVLILDEPTSGLDPNQAQDVRDYILELGKTKAILWSTHILSEIETLASRLYIINGGKVVAEGHPQTLMAGAQGGTVLRLELRSTKSGAEMRKSLEGVSWVRQVDYPSGVSVKSGWTAFTVVAKSEDDLDCASSLFRFCKDQDWELRHLSEQVASLEDVFRGLTRKGTP